MSHRFPNFVRRGFTLAALLVALGGGAARGHQPAIAGYKDDAAFVEAIHELAKHPRAKVESLAKTRGGRELWLITIAKGDPAAKPAILVTGGAHAPQLVGTELALRVAQRFAAAAEIDAGAGAGPSQDLSRFLDRFTVYVIPRLNPDATAACFHTPYYERATNETPTDDDRDAAIDEDPYEDLNGDGLITMLRIEDPAGDYLPSPLDPRVMIKADPARGEVGRYRLITEGVDNDHDEAFNEDPPGGVSFNSNFTAQYPFFGVGAGPHQVSEIETRAVADFAFAHLNIGLVFSFAPEDNLLEAWKSPEKPERFKFAPMAGDADRLGFLAEHYRDDRDVKGAPESPRGDGSFVRWAYCHYGRWSLGSRAWWIPQVAAKKSKSAANDAAAGKPAEPSNAEKSSVEKKPAKDSRGVDEANALRWFEREGIDGFVAWQAIEHPDFPGKKVEVGGFKPFLRTNPPAVEIDPLAERHCAYFASLESLLPRVKTERAKVEPLGDGVFRLSIKVVNMGYLPTQPEITGWAEHAQGLQLKLVAPEGVRLLMGAWRTRLDPLGGGDGVEKVWVLRASPDGNDAIRATVYAPAVGSDGADVLLK